MHITEENNLLKLLGYEVIEEEKLPRPYKINFCYRVNGVKLRQGVCVRYKNNNNFTISVNTTKVNWIKCEKGTHINKKTGEEFRKGIGIDLTFKEKLDTLAHEIAHLKFWDHSVQHKSYTNHLISLLIEKSKKIGVEL